MELPVKWTFYEVNFQFTVFFFFFFKKKPLDKNSLLVVYIGFGFFFCILDSLDLENDFKV